MPAPTAPFIGLALGAAFAWAAADELARRGGTAAGSRGMVVALTFGLGIFAPAAGYFLAFWPDWCFAYLLNTERLPAYAALLLVLFNAASCPLGFAVAAKAAGERRPMRVARLSAFALIPALAWLLATFKRLAVSATYAQFHGDFGIRPVAGSALGYALLYMAIVVAATAIWTIHALRRLSSAAARS
jgi:hypothetical protein